MTRDQLITLLMLQYARRYPRATSLAKDTYEHTIKMVLDDMLTIGAVITFGEVVQ